MFVHRSILWGALWAVLPFIGLEGCTRAHLFFSKTRFRFHRAVSLEGGRSLSKVALVRPHLVPGDQVSVTVNDQTIKCQHTAVKSASEIHFVCLETQEQKNSEVGPLSGNEQKTYLWFSHGIAKPSHLWVNQTLFTCEEEKKNEISCRPTSALRNLSSSLSQ
jgi:hypothetical protein